MWNSICLAFRVRIPSLFLGPWFQFLAITIASAVGVGAGADARHLPSNHIVQLIQSSE